MKIAMLGSLGNINRIVVPKLIADGHDVLIITTRPERVPAIEKLGATAAVGSMEDVDFLTDTFSGADLAYLMLSVSGSQNRGNMFERAQQVGNNFRDAVQNSGVKHVVNLSSIAAQNGPEVGALPIYHFIENALLELNGVDVTFIRPVGFYSNLYANIPSIKASHTIVSNVPSNIPHAWVAPSDIAAVVLSAMKKPTAGHNVVYVVSEMSTPDEYVPILAEALDMPDLRYVEITDGQQLAGLIASGLTEAGAKGFLQMNIAGRTPDKFYADLYEHMPVLGQVKMTDFAKEFVQVYNAQ
ncbi:short-chain dehydrogenase [Periweissella cryptocerci]|uniref:Short-chain dehydrogenase n=1 Tax=Periweissella cryptocerci TaxID=2506420 RepID=A0A4P6YVT6_9LACO|nr:NAD(P)H-binding protein [Periweissella cryptocerci]QBO36910.1 short-chain dehydrogenase [Periweissella cryptocerci]